MARLKRLQSKPVPDGQGKVMQRTHCLCNECGATVRQETASAKKMLPVLALCSIVAIGALYAHPIYFALSLIPLYLMLRWTCWRVKLEVVELHDADS
jgi:hypothetical protein